MKLAKFNKETSTVALPIKLGDTVFFIGRNDTPNDTTVKITKGIVSKLNLIQSEVDGDFIVSGEITFKSYDWFYNDGRYTDNKLFFGQGKYRLGDTVFKTYYEAHEAKLLMIKENK